MFLCKVLLLEWSDFKTDLRKNIVWKSRLLVFGAANGENSILKKKALHCLVVLYKSVFLICL